MALRSGSYKFVFRRDYALPSDVYPGIFRGVGPMRIEPRVAFFPDSFAEVNGVAHTSRQFVAFAERRNLPMLCVHGCAGAAGGWPSRRDVTCARQESH